MSKKIHTQKFDTIKEANQFIKDFIDSEFNLKNEYPWYVIDKYQGYGGFCIDYTC